MSENFTYATETAMPTSASGRTPKANPHAEVLAALAGTEGVRSFTLPDPDKDAKPGTITKERDLLVSRHQRYLRAAARDNNRGVRVAATVDAKAGTVTITFADKPLVLRPRGDKE